MHIFVSQFRPTGWLADSSLGWGRLATEGAEVVTYEGDHWSIFDEPGAGQAAAIIAAALGSSVGPQPLEGTVRFGNRSPKRPIHAS